MSNWKKALVTFVLALSLFANGCSLFPSNNPNQPGPVRFKTTQKRKITPTIPIRPTRMGRMVRVIPTKVGQKVKVFPTKVGGTIKKDIKKITPLTPMPTPKALKGVRR